MQLIIRPLDYATDLPSVVALYNQSNFEQITVETVHEWNRNAQAGGIRYRLSAFDADDRLVGYGHVVRDPYMADGLYWLHVIVAGTDHHRGYGQQIYAALLDYARSQGATQLRGEVRDNCLECLHFAIGCGFEIERHLFESTLDLASFDESRFVGAIERVEATGTRFFSVADEGDTEAIRRKLWEINTRTGHDVPGDTGETRPFEVFQQQVCNASWYRADGEILAADGEQVIGMSAVGYFENADIPYMYNMMTGIDRAYRGRGIALALKLLTIRCARRYAATYIRTNNDEKNAPMLAINRRLGYQPEPGLYRMLKQL